MNDNQNTNEIGRYVRTASPGKAMFFDMNTNATLGMQDFRDETEPGDIVVILRPVAKPVEKPATPVKSPDKA